MSKPKFATIWLDGCSGCHMSFLDIDERIVALSELVDVVYSPLVDSKEMPEDVDITLVEGAISSVEDLEKIRKVRKRTKILVVMGDCAITGNVPAMRNSFGPEKVLEHAYLETTSHHPMIPNEVIPKLLKNVRPVHDVVKVDVYLPGCPPPADAIFYVLTELLAGREPETTKVSRFGK